MFALLTRILVSTLFVSICWGQIPETGEIQYELRISLNSDGFNFLIDKLGDQLQSPATRADFYMDVYRNGEILFRKNSELPTKVRIKDYGGDWYHWQVSRRLTRSELMVGDLPISITEVESFERLLTPEEGESIIKRFSKALNAIRNNREKKTKKQLAKFENAVLQAHENQNLPGLQFIGDLPTS